MKNKLTLLLLLLMLLFSSVASHSQDEDVLRPRGRDAKELEQLANRRMNSQNNENPWTYGIDVGLNINMYSETMSGLQPDSRYSAFESGLGFSPIIGVYLDYALSKETGIQLKVAIDQKDFGNNKDGKIVATNFTNNSAIDAFINREYDIRATYITLTPQFRWNFTQDFFLLAGPTIHVQGLNSTLESKETIISPDNVFYNFGLPNQSKVIESKIDNFEINSTRVGLEFDLGYQYKVTPNMIFVPKIGFQYMLTNFVESENFFDDSRSLTDGLVLVETKDAILNSLQFSIGIWYNF